MQKYRVWTCKIAVPWGADLPGEFDGPPRNAAVAAVEAEAEVAACFSGWGGELSDSELSVMGEFLEQGASDDQD